MINSFFRKVVQVKLPTKIEELISNESRDNLNIDYFEENKDQLVNLQCICFSLKDFFIIVKGVKNRIDLFCHDNLLVKSMDKIYYQENYLMNKMKENEKKHFLIFNHINNPSKVELLYPKTFRFTFNYNEDNTDSEFILVRIKYCVKRILRSLNMISPRVYSHLAEADTTEKLFLGLNQIIQLEEYSDNSTNDKIPLNWYSLYLTSNLQYLKTEYQKNNFELLYKELITEARKEIEHLNYKSNLLIAKYGLNLRCAEKINEILKKDVVKVRQIEKFIRIEEFINNGKIKVCVRKNTKDDQNLIDAGTIIVNRMEDCIHQKFHFLDRVIEGKVDKKTFKNNGNGNDKNDGHCESISDFIKTLQNYHEVMEDIIFGDQRHKIYETLDVYLQFLRDSITKHELFSHYSEDQLSEVCDDIENYIQKKIYKKVFPSQELERDNNFYDQCCRFEWVSPIHLEINKKYLNERLWNIAMCNLNKMDNEKSAVDKLKCVQGAYKILNNSINFCSGKDENAGVDDIIPILIYILLKSKPRRIFSNIHYVRTFMNPSKLLATYGFLLTQIEMATEFIFAISNKVLKVDKDEYQKYLYINI